MTANYVLVLWAEGLNLATLVIGSQIGRAVYLNDISQRGALLMRWWLCSLSASMLTFAAGRIS